MILDEVDAVRYALGRVHTILYPKRYAYKDVIERGHLEEVEFSYGTLEKLKGLQNEILGEMNGERDQRYAYLHFLRHDIVELVGFLGSNSVDFTGIQKRLYRYAEEIVIPELKEKLGVDYQAPPVNFVKALPGRQWPGRKGGGFGADRWQAERYGMPEGIFVHEASLVEGSERLLIHELAHPAIEAFPNFVPWFDEGLCNLMAYWIYSETEGSLGFRRAMKYRQEFEDYYFSPGRLFRRPDNMFCSLLLIGGFELVKVLMRYKRDRPEKIRWNIIPSLLQTFIKEVIEEPVELPEPVISPIHRRIASTVLAHNISHVLSPLALLVYQRILERKPRPGTWRLEELLDEHLTEEGVVNVVSELRQRSLVWVFPGGEFEPYMGPHIGTNHFVEAGLVRAWARRYKLDTWE